MNIYNYNKLTTEFLKESQATPNPREKGKFLIPANATIIKPLDTKDGFSICFNKELKKWEYKEDNRNKIVYSTHDKTESRVDYIGIIKDEFTLLKPNVFDKWSGTSWILDIEELRSKKLIDISIAYQKENYTDISYMNATFQADKESQDLISKVLSAGTVPENFGWSDKENNKIAMTYAQLQGLSAAILFRSQPLFFKHQDMKKTIKSCTTTEQLNSIE